MRIVIREIVRRIVRRMGDTSLLLMLLVIIALMIASKATAAQYEFRGVFRAVDVFTAYCTDCFLELPPEFLESSLVLAVQTDKEKVFRQALRNSAKGAGWNLTDSGKRWRAEPVQNAENVVYLSCETNQPVNVPKYLYAYAVRGDSIRCAMQRQQQQKADSIAEYERRERLRRDSVQAEGLPFVQYTLRYYSYTKNFADKVGAEFGAVVGSGNLRGKLRLYDDWKFWATETGDTTFTYRHVNVAFDSLVNVDWGTEEQTLKQSYVTQNGVINNDYEWRKYGLIVTISKDTARTKLQYIFRDKEQNVSLLQGAAVGRIGDTLRVSGQYNVKREVTTGLPVLSRIPLIKYLVSTTQVLTDIKQFELYLIPNAYTEVQQNANGTITQAGAEPQQTKSTENKHASR